MKQALLERRMLAADLADMLGVSRASLTHIMAGRRVGKTYRAKIAEALGYPEEWLFEQGGNFDQDTTTAATQHDAGAVVAQY